MKVFSVFLPYQLQHRLYFVRQNTHSNTDSNTQTNIDFGPVKTVTIPYIRGTSETIARILQPYNVLVAHKPITTWRRQLTDVKDKDKPEDRQVRQVEVYKIKYCNCQATYIGETGRKLACDWLNTNAQWEMVTSTITLLSTIYRQNIKLTGTLQHVLCILL